MQDNAIKTVRLGAGDRALAKATFAMMADVFEEPSGELGDDYLAALLARSEFWAIAALEGDEPIGGITAHTLPMTRSATSELFIYDLAVRADRQRRGVGRMLVAHLRAAAAAEAITNVFVPADDEDLRALDFYRALGGDAAPVTIFTFGRPALP